LLHRAEAGERLRCALKLCPTLKLGEGSFRALVKSELLGAVCEALRAHKLKHELSEATVSGLLGDELTRLDHERLMQARFVAERLEVLPLSTLNPMVLCPAGELYLGAEERVKITEPFLMGQTQVTQALWRAVMGENPSCFQGSTLPVERVSWFDMVRFCNRLSELECFRPAYHIESGEGSDELSVHLKGSANGYRLPTEDEWVYAAQAGTALMYAGSERVDEVAWYGSNSNFKTREVATKKPNAWGLYDMSGNVWEWCYDQRNTQAHTTPAEHITHGGGWHYAAGYCSVMSRGEAEADKRRNDLGGRLLRRNTDK
jgi:formylglycine-generating enzyme